MQAQLCTCLVIQHLNTWLHFILALYSLYRMVTEWEMSFLLHLYWSARGPDRTHANCSDDGNEHNRKRECPRILKQFHSLQLDHICPSLFPPSSSQGARGHLRSPAGTHTQVSGGSKASRFLVALVFRDARNLISQITSHIIFSRLQFPLNVSVASAHLCKYDPPLSNTKWGRWS